MEIFNISVRGYRVLWGVFELDRKYQEDAEIT
jgi:hypothetical protein